MGWDNSYEPVTGDLITAAQWITSIQDNFSETPTAKVTTKGDLTPATGANAIARLGVGSDYKGLFALSSASTGLAYNDARYMLYKSNTTIEVKNTVVQTSILPAYSVAANLLYGGSANHGILGTILARIFNDTGGAQNAAFALKYDDTTIASITVSCSAHGTIRQFIRVEFTLRGNGATNAQIGGLSAQNYWSLNHSGACGTAAEDSTGAKNLDVLVTLGAASNSFYIDTDITLLELIY
jgi:hypothetical protein